jgi:hypothetical protein
VFFSAWKFQAQRRHLSSKQPCLALEPGPMKAARSGPNRPPLSNSDSYTPPDYPGRDIPAKPSHWPCRCSNCGRPRTPANCNSDRPGSRIVTRAKQCCISRGLLTSDSPRQSKNVDSGCSGVVPESSNSEPNHGCKLILWHTVLWMLIYSIIHALAR